MKFAISVSQLIQYLKRTLDRDDNMQGVLLKGEISNFVHHRSGHCYFTLKDASAKISCVMFATHAAKLSFPVENGMQVLVRGNVSLFEAGGQLQLYVESMTPEGLGLLYLKLEELKQRFLKEGLFDAKHKKPLIPYPKKIAVISAKEGAATQDVFTTIQRRWPVAEILFFPCLVQGKSAASQIAQTLQYADTHHPDVILLVRGGGAMEDLWAFNEEAVVRGVYACHSVVVSGVGHETDTTLVDYVSDHRAPTPTAAAELATPNIVDVSLQVNTYHNRLQHSVQQQLQRKQQQLNAVVNHPFLKHPGYVIQQKQQQFDVLSSALLDFTHRFEQKKSAYERVKHVFLRTDIGISQQKEMLLLSQMKLYNEMKQRFTKHQQQLVLQIAKLEAYSPLAIMKKGYALTYQNNQLIKSLTDIDLHTPIRIQYPDGSLHANPTHKEDQHDPTTIAVVRTGNGSFE